MKAQKNKIVFVLVTVSVVLFITVYALLTFGKVKKTELNPERIPMPDLDGNTKEYESKMEALEAIKEEREIMVPQMYPDHMVDGKGYFNPDYMEYEKQRIIDSVYHSKNFGENALRLNTGEPPVPTNREPEAEKEKASEPTESISVQEMALKHQLFFASRPLPSTNVGVGEEVSLLAYVDGDQTLREGHRLALRLQESVQMGEKVLSRGARIYGFVKLRPNRVMVEIDQVENFQVKLQGHDFQDGQVGIYVENHLKGEVVHTGVDETLSQVNLPGLPPLGGIKRIFQRDRMAVQVAVADHYQIILKRKK